MKARIEELGGGIVGETRARRAGRILDTKEVGKYKYRYKYKGK